MSDFLSAAMVSPGHTPQKGSKATRKLHLLFFMLL